MAASPEKLGAYMGDRQVAPGRDGVPQACHGPRRVVRVGHGGQDREQPDRHWPTEVQVRAALRQREQVRDFACLRVLLPNGLGIRPGHVLSVARAPDDPPVFQANRRWRVHGQRDEVGITVIIQPDGRIWSAWPDAGSPGVVKNPRETQ
jgi:hypothetical protein